MFDPKKLNYVPGNDLLQTRSRLPRHVMPNIALYCDWVIWDNRNVYVDFSLQPKVVYVRSEINVLNFFIEHVLGRIDNDFVLLTSSHDSTMPLGFHRQFGLDWERIVTHQHMKAWFTENRDLVHDKIKPVPLGIPQPDLSSWITGADGGVIWDDEFFRSATGMVKEDRLRKIFCCWYPRDDHPSGTCPSDNNERQSAYNYIIKKTDLFDWHQPGMSRLDFIGKLGAYKFVLCPHGGGIDPNPRCWESLIMGAIPIIKRNTMSESLEHLPVVIVDDWSDITHEAMNAWLHKWSPALNSDDLMKEMSNSYYYNKMLDHLEGN